MKDYKRITVQDIIDYIKSEPEKFPDGMKTVIVSGDFECNYTHEKHEIQDMVGCTLNKKKFPNAICLGYEMHEGESCVWDSQKEVDI